MAETFVITVLSFALVLAVVAALLVWVILPALKEEDDETKTKELTLSDYIDEINFVHDSAKHYDMDQQDTIDNNAEEIQKIKADMAAATAATASAPSGGAVSTATEASATYDGGMWTIKSGGVTFKAKATHMCDSSANNCNVLDEA